MKEKEETKPAKLDGDTLSRRDFVRQAGAVSAGYVVTTASTPLAQQAVDRKAIVAAMGDTLVPSAAGDPGYRDLESHGISDEVLKGLAELDDELFGLFDQSSAKHFGGRSFVRLSEEERAQYLKAIIKGDSFQGTTLEKLRSVYTLLRIRVFSIYYQNFPENKVPKDSQGIPSAEVTDPHQIINPNTKELVTGWDVANYPGPVRWEEEEQLRARMKGILWDKEG